MKPTTPKEIPYEALPEAQWISITTKLTGVIILYIN